MSAPEMDLTTTGIMAASNVLASAVAPRPAAPSSADSVFSTNLAFDNSGWNVNTGGGSLSAPVQKSAPQIAGGQMSGAAQANPANLTWAMFLVGGLVLWKVMSK